MAYKEPPNIDADLHAAKFIVGDTSNGANYATIAAAITAAGAGPATIAIQPGTYTENITLPANINLTGFGCDASLNGTGTVIISGTITKTSAGSSTISGIQLQTNSAALLAVTGSAASVVNLENCYLNMTNATGITFSSSSASSIINTTGCTGNLVTTGIAVFSHSASGLLRFIDTVFNNTGNSTTANTVSAGTCQLIGSIISNPITTSGTGALTYCVNSLFDCGGINTTALTIGGSGTAVLTGCDVYSGTATAIVTTTTTGFLNGIIGSSNANICSGAGTLNYTGVLFSNTGNKFSNTTQSDYGAATFTPVLEFGGGTTGITYTSQVGRFKRVDSIVYIQVSMLLTSKGSSTGTATISGLPFAARTLEVNLLMGIENLTFSAGYSLPIGFTVLGSSSIGLYQEGTIVAGAVMTNVNFANNTLVTIQGFYFV